jgi:predicted DsbA family dithiol-disulfide isomerase
MTNAKTVTVEIVSDAICPWCWIGKRHLESAAALLGEDVAIETVWKPFELKPDMPKGGVERSEYRRRKFGSLEVSERLDAQVAEKGRAAGLNFRHDLMQWTPNTIDCHRLIRFAGIEGRQDAMVEALFQAYFAEGRNIGDHGVMADIAESAGLDRGRVEAMLASGEGAGEVHEELIRANGMGITGVPTFMIGGQPICSGAAPPEMLARAIAEAAGARVA